MRFTNLALLLLGVGFTLSSRCGPDYGNNSCSKNECCSKWGYCGTSDKHCYSGCQNGFGKCKNNKSSSSSSKKKTTSTSSKKKTTSSKKNITTSSKKGKKTTVTTTTTTTVFTIPNITSIPTFDPFETHYCGPNHENKSCPSGECCGENGTCGVSVYNCVQHCQPQFGYCMEEFDFPNPEPPKKEPLDGNCGPNHGGKKCTFGHCCSKDGTCGFSLDHCGEGCQSDYGDCLHMN